MANQFGKVFIRELTFVTAKSAWNVYPNQLPRINYSGTKTPGAYGNVVSIGTGLRLVTALGFPLGKFQRQQTFAPYNAAITVGIKAAGAITILAAQALAAGAATVVAAGFTQPDIPRSINFVTNNASCGDGTFTTATAKIVVIVGLDQFNISRTESVALNGTTTVSTLWCYQSVTSITFPSQFAGGDTCTTTVGTKFALERPVQAAADLLEIERKASAATAYTVETLPATTDIGEGYGPIATVLPYVASWSAPFSTTIQVLTTAIVGSFPNSTYIAEFLGPNGNEKVTVTGTAISGLYTVITFIRGLHGAPTPLRNYNAGAYINRMPAMSISPTLTADDRLCLRYRSAVE